MGSVSLALLLAAPALADGPLGPEGSALTTSNYTIDLFRGPVIGTARMVGLGGAFVAIAEGVEGGLQNPAAVAHRQAQWPDWYDYWLAFSFTYPFDAGDFYNSGNVLDEQNQISDQNFFFFIPGFSFQMWQAGIGLTIDTQVTTVKVTPSGGGDPQTIRLGFPTYHIQFGYGFVDGQVIVGAGLRIMQERIKLGDRALGGGQVGYKSLGFGGEVGIMIKPNGKHWRIGASLYPKLTTSIYRGGFATVTPEGDLKAGDFFLPREGVDPWHGSVGFSWQFGPRPPNPAWIQVEDFAGNDLARIDDRIAMVKERKQRDIEKLRAAGGPDVECRVQELEKRYDRNLKRLEQARKNVTYAAWKILRERYRNEWPRRYYLLSTELLITGQVGEGVGVESFFAQRVQRSGENVGYSPRLGFETEVWPKRMKARTGTYIEPSRFQETDLRVHWTVGFDVRVLHWDVFGLWPEDYLWDIKVAFDIARDYRSFTLGIGGWY
ncbi:MAG: hypothetical protein WBM46_19835 [Polyangiales bacterium]